MTKIKSMEVGDWLAFPGVRECVCVAGNRLIAGSIKSRASPSWLKSDRGAQEDHRGG